jgi:hypothetical protein
MSVFSMLKRGRQAAKEHAAKQAEKQKREAEQPPYKHVPRHAASDALAGGPATWREDDRPKIMEQNRRRSMMTANGLNMSGTSTPAHVGFPRVNSALSHVSYPAAYASPLVQMPRAYSYTSVQQPGWSHHGGEVVYTPMETPNVSVKGKEVERVAMVDSGRASRTSSKGSFGPYPVERSATTGGLRTSPVGSSSNSTSSQDDLEMKTVKHPSAAQAVAPSKLNTNSPSPVQPAGQVDYFHRFQPAKSRRISDPPTPNQYAPQTRSSYTSQKQGGPRVTSLPATASGIPPVPALPPMHFGTSLSQANITSSSSAASSSSKPVSRATSSSSITMVPHTNMAARGSPPRLPVAEEIAGPIPINDAESYFSYLPEVGMAVTTPSAGNNKRKMSKTARFTELEPISSHVSESTFRNQPAPIPAPAPFKPEVHTTVMATHALPTMFDEASLPQQPIMPSPQKRGKLSKNPSSEPKPVKRNRWSLRGSKPTAVAV